MELANRATLTVHANHAYHAQIESLLLLLWRVADLAVVMNARIYEVDRAFYSKHVASLFERKEEKAKERLLARASRTLLKSLDKQQPVLRSDAGKILPGDTTAFLSRH